MLRRRFAAVLIAAVAFVALPACESDDAAKKDAKEAKKQVQDEGKEAKTDIDKEIKD
jgi:hypothetical protein